MRELSSTKSLEAHSDFEERNKRSDRNRPLPRERRWDEGIKIDVGEFEGHFQTNTFLDWVNKINQYFEYK